MNSILDENSVELHRIRRFCAREVLGLYKKANAGHIGSSLSCLEILIAIFFKLKREEDYVLLSKGHAAAALYVVLAEKGLIPKSELETFYKDHTNLAAHPPCSNVFPSIPFGTGSLGHGLSLAAGLAISQKFTQKSLQVFAVLSDGECNEGSTWEAALFASHHQLHNLTVVVDMNGIQGLGRTEDVLNMAPMADKWKSFGFETTIAENGNQFDSLITAFNQIGASKRPKCILAMTTKGHSVSYMENKMEWHYLPMSDEQYETALRELDLESKNNA